MTERVLLTGAGGFVGSHVLRHLLMETDWEILCPVTFQHQGRAARIESSLAHGRSEWRSRVHVLPQYDLRLPIRDIDIAPVRGVDYIFNVASESHVDRSITGPAEFISNNVSLMTTVLDLARIIEPRLVLHMSTDEVYGPARLGEYHREWDTVLPSNPYSASKAAQEAIAFSYWRTYGVPLVITNTMNIIGEMQHPEKFLPLALRRIYDGEQVPLHAERINGEWDVSSRCWLHARNLADAWLFIAQRPELIQRYPEFTVPQRLHVVGEELSVLELADRVALAAGKELQVEFIEYHSSRPGHDMRYALDGSKLEGMGWKPPTTLDESIRRTVEWTLEHPEWLL